MRRRFIEDKLPTGSYPEPLASECAISFITTGVSATTFSTVITVPLGTRAIVLCKPASDFTVKPIDFSSDYTANQVYTAATDLTGGTGTPRVVLDVLGTGGAQNRLISGLAFNTIYFLKVFSFTANANNDFNTRNYNTANIISVAWRTNR